MNPPGKRTATFSISRGPSMDALFTARRHAKSSNFRVKGIFTLIDEEGKRAAYEIEITDVDELGAPNTVQFSGILHDHGREPHVTGTYNYQTKTGNVTATW